MYIQVTTNLYPCDSKPTSFIATGALAIAVASAILAGLAIYLEWGAVAIASLSGGAGMASLVAFAIICCRKPTLPEKIHHLGARQRDYSIQGSIDALNDEENKEVGRELYRLVKTDDLAGFKAALSAKDVAHWDFFFDAHIFIDEDDHTTHNPSDPRAFFKAGSSLFGIILAQKDIRKKEAFLQAALEKMPDHQIEIFRHEEVINELLKIHSTEVIGQVLTKFRKESVRSIINSALDPKKEPNYDWFAEFQGRLESDKTLQEVYFLNDILKRNIESKMGDKISKIKYFVAVKNGWFWRDPEVESAIEQFEVKISENSTTTLMHWAIEAEDEALVSEFTQYKTLLNKPSRSEQHLISPLRCASLKGNEGIVKILTAAGAQN